MNTENFEMAKKLKFKLEVLNELHKGVKLCNTPVISDVVDELLPIIQKHIDAAQAEFDAL